MSYPSCRLHEDCQPSRPQPNLVLLGYRLRRPRKQRGGDEEEAQGEVGGDWVRPVERRMGFETGGESGDGA